jgi:5-methylcytosine-specific restriction protein A
MPRSKPSAVSDKARGNAAARGYDWKWQQAAKRFKRQYPLCGMRPNGQKPVMSECHASQILTPATVVDHQVPHRGNFALFWDEEGNWCAMCASCHGRKSRAGL